MDDFDNGLVKELVMFMVGVIIWAGVVLVALMEFIIFWLRFRGVI